MKYIEEPTERSAQLELRLTTALLEHVAAAAHFATAAVPPGLEEYESQLALVTLEAARKPLESKIRQIKAEVSKGVAAARAQALKECAAAFDRAMVEAGRPVRGPRKSKKDQVDPNQLEMFTEPAVITLNDGQTVVALGDGRVLDAKTGADVKMFAPVVVGEGHLNSGEVFNAVPVPEEAHPAWIKVADVKDAPAAEVA